MTKSKDERIAELETEVAYLRNELGLSLAHDDIALVSERLDLTKHEADLLMMLHMAKGRVLSIPYLDEHLPEKFPPRDGNNAIRVHVHRIRRRMGAGSVETVGLLGYRISPESSLLVTNLLLREKS